MSRDKRFFSEFKPIGNHSPKKENKYIFIAMLILLAFALMLILRAAS